MNEEQRVITPKKIMGQTDKSDASYYHKNKPKIKIQQRIYYQQNKNRLNSYGNAYYSENKDRILERNKNSDKKSDYDRKYYLENKEKIRQRKKYLYQQNKIRSNTKKIVNS